MQVYFENASGCLNRIFVNKNIKWHRLAIFMSRVVNIGEYMRIKGGKWKIFSIFAEIEIFMF